MSPEKRDTSRIAVLGNLQGEMTIYQTIVIKEIGPGGVLIETGFPLQLNSLHDVRLDLRQPIVVKGRVAHSRISDVDQEIVTYQTGIEFVEPSDRVVSAIKEYLASIKTEPGI